MCFLKQERAIHSVVAALQPVLRVDSLSAIAVLQVLADWHRSCIAEPVNVLRASFDACGDAR
ncbi:hypothetical protein [Rhodanobacter sp. BL-MT-08]